MIKTTLYTEMMHLFYQYLYLVILILCSVVKINGQTCAKLDDCSCQFEDGTVVDLKSIGNTDGTPKFLDLMAQDNYYYSYNPCYPFSQGGCANAAACQRTPDSSAFYLIGDPTTADFTFDSVSVHIVYTAPGEGSGTRITDVALVCDPTSQEPFAVANGETATQQYSFTLTHRCACPGLCGGATPNPGTPTPKPPETEEGISIGTIICIVALAIAVVYIAAGITFQKVQRQASGKEVIPNVSFWQAVPGLIKEGFVFTFGICRKGPANYDKI